MADKNIIKQFYNKYLKYNHSESYNFFISTENSKDISNTPVSPAKNLEPKTIFKNLTQNMDFIKSKYNSLISSDVIIRDFSIWVQNKEFNASIVYIDGMVDSQIINENILKPLILRNKSNTYISKNKKIISEFNNNDVIIRKIKKINLENYISSHLIPQNDIKQINDFESIFSGINMGNCILLIDTLKNAFTIDVKNFKQRSISTPQNEIVIRGSQEAFVENIRTNTSILRRIINNENLIIENTTVGKITKTKVAICYLKDISNNDLVAEVKYRVNNLDIDYLLSSRTT
ncbi:MAG: spore germination protein [Clostridiales bacterium]|nr:spore germination protein [Clostridiales bacterium]